MNSNSGMEVGSFGVRLNRARLELDQMENELVAHLREIRRLLDDSPYHAKYQLEKMIASLEEFLD